MYEMKNLQPKFEVKVPNSMYEMKNVTNVNLVDCQTTSNGAAANGEESTYGESDNKRSRNATSSACSFDSRSFSCNATTPTTTTSRHIDSNIKCVLDLDILGARIQQVLKSSCDTSSIVLRQDKVLQQLLELKKQMAAIRSTLGLCQKGIQHTKLGFGPNGGLKEESLHDVVINGHPNFIPYALLALKNAWRDLFTIDIKTYTHSTMSDIGPEAHAFEEQLKAVPVDITKPTINVSLIWKNCEHTEMISSPTMYVPIYGEVNIIRYLGRVGPEQYRYENSPLVNEIDAVLDICYQLLRCTTPKARAAMLRALNNRLQKQPYFGGDQMSIADIGVHSSLKRMPIITDKELTPALSAWRKRAQQVTLI